MAQIDQFLKVLVEQGGSDLHLTAGKPEAALEAYQTSAALFEQSDAVVYLQGVREKIEKLNSNGM